MDSWPPRGVSDATRRQVILYELNEVPWEIIDLYADARPSSNVAALLDEGLCLTTVDDDPVPLQPWRTWPTFHRSAYTTEHGSLDLGQDPATFNGTDLWEVADAAGCRVGVFGAMQSWPPRQGRNGGFFVPDTFARSAETYPSALSRFQRFNLRMTADNSFASDRGLAFGDVVAAGVDLVRLGLSPWSTAKLVAHLGRERLDERYKARRPIMQVLPSFDLFWRLHKRTAPDLSVFFTNHVAAMMHRYWGDGVPRYAVEHGYQPDDVYRGFLLTAMDLFDHQLGVMRRWAHRHPGRVLIVASSMGQGPIPYAEMNETYVLEHTTRLVGALGLDGVEPGLAMYPRICLKFDNQACAEVAMEPIASVRTRAGPMFNDLRLHGATVSFEIDYQFGVQSLSRDVTWIPRAGRQESGTVDNLGIAARTRPGGGNTAYHVPEGILVAVGSSMCADPARAEVSILDAAPSILDLLDVDAAPSMRGTPSLFPAAAGPRRRGGPIPSTTSLGDSSKVRGGGCERLSAGLDREASRPMVLESTLSEKAERRRNR